MSAAPPPASIEIGKRVAGALATASGLGTTVARVRGVNVIGGKRLAVGTTRSVVLASLALELAQAAADTRTVATPLSATECSALFLPALHLSLCTHAVRIAADADAGQRRY